VVHPGTQSLGRLLIVEQGPQPVVIVVIRADRLSFRRVVCLIRSGLAVR
jgi:hypothetical protein